MNKNHTDTNQLMSKNQTDTTNKTNINQIVNVQIEIPRGQSVKYEINHDTQQLICDRFLHVPFAYPFNYGYICETMGGDGDPLDAVVICKPSLYPTSLIKCRIIGALITSDENGLDEKILLVPDINIDPYNKNIMSYTDLDSHTLQEIEYFFRHYKDLEPNKFINIESFVSTNDAINIYLGSQINNHNHNHNHNHDDKNTNININDKNVNNKNVNNKNVN